MKRLVQLGKKLSSFKTDTRGNIALMTGLMLFIIFGASGLALDYSRMISVRSKVAAAADSAVLAVGNNLLNGITDDNRNRQDFEAMLSVNLEGIIPLNSFDIDNFVANPDTGEVRADLSANMPLTIMGIFGFNDANIGINAGAIFEQDNVEIAMVLDNTGSMRGSRINALRTAAQDAVNILIPGETSNSVRIGLVPYSSSVNAGRYARTVTRGNDERDVASAGVFVPGHMNVPTTRCTTERNGREAFTDASYVDAPLGSDLRTVNAIRRSVNDCPDLTIRPLTANKRNLLNDISRMGARGFTAGHIGISWSYYMLSENWNGLWPRESEASPYNGATRKVAIIMTDGIFNTFYNGTEGTNATGPHSGLSNQRAIDLCDNMRAAKAGNPGITVYSIAFEAPERAQEVLQACANEDTAQDQFYYEADSAEELQAAFREIATSIQRLRLTQ